MRNYWFPIRKRGFFGPGKEIKGLLGGVHQYTVQVSPQIDAARAEKERFRVETKYISRENTGTKELQMHINMIEKNGVVIVFIKEERLDAHNSNDLKSAVKELFESGKKDILVDLRDVRFIDSSGLGALVSGFKNAITQQGVLKLSTLQPQVKSMFELTRLHRVFEIFTTTDDALDSF